MNLRIKNIRHTVIISSIVLVLIFVLLAIPSLTNFFTSATHYFIYRDDSFQNLLWKHDFTPSKNIVLIGIDDASLNAFQAQGNTKMLTIPKSVYVSLIQKLQSVWVRAIGFDIVFQNPTPEDESFVQALSQYKNAVIATTEQSTCNVLSEGDFILMNSSLLWESGSTYSWSQESLWRTQWRNWNSWDIRGACAGIPLPIYWDITWWLANIGNSADQRLVHFDIWGVSYSSWKKEKTIYTFPLAIYKKLSGTRSGQEEKNIFSKILTWMSDVIFWSWGNDSSMGTWMVLSPFFWPPHSYTMIPLWHVINTMTRADLIQNFWGKVVIIGDTWKLFHDSVVSPVTDTEMPWMESHAHFLDWLLQNKIPHALSWERLIFLLILLTCVSVSLYRILPSRYALPVAVFIFLFLIFLGRFSYNTFGLVVNIFPLLLAGSLLSYPATFIYEYFVVNREKRFIQSAFSRYLDPTVVQKITEGESMVSLSGEHKDLTVFFSDIEGFTTIAEALKPQALFRLMSTYLSTMTDILMSEKGTLDKYIGDGIMGFFWAPLELPHHPYHAVNTAMRMREALPSFNENFVPSWVWPIHFRVGIATWDVIVGNIGSHERFNYTVLWDTVNLAARLEPLGKIYHTSITVTEEIFFAAREHFLFRKLDRIRVKGKTKPVTIYECVSRRTQETHTLSPILQEYERCLDLYFAGKYFDAGIGFEKNGWEDPTSLMMAKRCLILINEKRTLTDGVWEMQTK